MPNEYGYISYRTVSGSITSITVVIFKSNLRPRFQTENMLSEYAVGLLQVAQTCLAFGRLWQDELFVSFDACHTEKSDAI